MIQILVTVSLSLFAIGLAINTPRVWAAGWFVHGMARWVTLAWTLMFVALGLFFECIGEGSGAGVDAESKNVDFVAVELGANLYAGKKRDTEACGGFGGLGDCADGVVVGDCHGG